jgi:hypothetical protein
MPIDIFIKGHYFQTNELGKEALMSAVNSGPREGIMYAVETEGIKATSSREMVRV